jgi:pimeloyl-ACP methyl ester carboxylesterase
MDAKRSIRLKACGPQLTAWRRQPRFVALVATVLLTWAGGCSCCYPSRTYRVSSAQPCDTVLAPWQNNQVVFRDRLEQGYTIILPGILGSEPLDHGILHGLEDANVNCAIELYDWTEGPLLLVYNLCSLDHSRMEAKKIAGKIAAYQDRYPGRPVHLIGYSGGGGLAVLALEALPPDRQITSAILIAPTLACDYDLQAAMCRTDRGIYNFYSPMDVPILMVLTTAFGTTEGRHTFAAGALGFEIPKSLDAESRNDYSAHLIQQSYTIDMIGFGHPGGHFGWTQRALIAEYVAPLLDSDSAGPTDRPPAGRMATASLHNADFRGL